MENLRSRTRKEIEVKGHYAITKFAQDILETADTLQMALNASNKSELESNPSLKSLHDGIIDTTSL